MKKKIFVSLLSMLVGVVCFAQPVSVTGKVVDTDGLEVVGASVFVNGTKVGTFTDASGNYKLDNVPGGSDAVLTFSFIGYETKEVVVGRQRVINVTLEPSASVLDEVVYVAYGQTKKKDLTGSITAVDGNAIAVQAQSTVTRALEGQVPGLQISSLDGQPGWDVGIRIRGIGTASQNNSNALIIIDGVPADVSVNPLSSINSNDIASVTILKDAASTALYGSRGANGVILVTTKRGQQGKTKVSFQARWGINTIGANGMIGKIGDSNPGEYYEFTWQSIYNALITGNTTDGVTMSSSEAATFASQHLFDYTGSTTSFSRNALGNMMLYSVPGATYTTTGSGTTASSTMSGAYLVNTDGRLNSDAVKLYGSNGYTDLLQTSFRQEYNVSASGGSDKMDYHISVGYLDDPSYVIQSSYERYSVRANVNAQLYSWLKAGANMYYAYRNTRQQATRYGRNPGAVNNNVFAYIMEGSPLSQTYARDLEGNYIYDEDGNKTYHMTDDDGYGTTLSPLGPTYAYSYSVKERMENAEWSVKSDDLNVKGYVTASFLKDFNFTVNVSYDKYFQNQLRYMDGDTWISYLNTNNTTNGSAMYRQKEIYSYITLQQMLDWSHDYGKHHVDALAGHEYWEYNYEKQYTGTGNSLINGGFTGYVNFLGTQTYSKWSSGTGGSLDNVAMESYFMRANYIYDDKYYASASLRRDGSSKFKYASNRWGTFWSVGAGWRISSESWMQGTKNWLDNLKVRGDFGLLGNQNGIANYSGYQTWSYSGSSWSQSSATVYPTAVKLTKSSWVNDGLTWEKVYTTDFGFDATLFKQKLSITFDWYNKETTNAIWSMPVSLLASGQSSLNQNTARIRNQGFEVDLSYQIFKNRDWEINFKTNGTHYNTKLISVPDGTGSDELDGCWTATTDAWSVAGGGSGSVIQYLRGEGKDYYNMYIYKYGGVAGNSWITEYYGEDNVLNDSSSRGLPLYYHRVTADEAAAGTFGSHVEGDDVLVTDYSLADLYECGDALPEWIGGFSFDVKWKNWDLSALFSYQLGGKFFSVQYGNALYRGSAYLGMAISDELYENTWSEDNVDAKFPMQIYGGGYVDGATIGSWAYTDMSLFSASYLSLKNITIGYTFPKKITDKLHISNLRLFASADNVFLLYGHSGVDPRWSIVGGMEVGIGTYPYMSSYNFGINLDF